MNKVKLSTLYKDTCFKVGDGYDWIATPIDLLDEAIRDHYYAESDIPKVYIANPVKIKINAREYLENIAEDVANDGNMHEDWELAYTAEHAAKLQAVLDEIIAYNDDNCSYEQGAEVEIDLPEYLPEIDND